MATYENTIPLCVKWLQWQPFGATSEDVADALDLSVSHCATAMKIATTRGLMGWVYAPVGNAHNRRMFYALKHLPELNGEASKLPALEAHHRRNLNAPAAISQWPKQKPAPAEREAPPSVISSAEARPWAHACAKSMVAA